MFAIRALVRILIVQSIILLALQTGWSGVWSTGGPQHKSIKVVAVSPQSPNIVYAGAFGWGVFKSSDGGTTWTNYRTGIINTYVRSLLVLSDTVVYAGTNDGVFKTTNGGNTWVPVLLTIYSIRSISFDPGTGSIYAASYGSGLYKSTNQGSTWTQISVTDPNTLQTLSHLWAVAVFGRDSMYVGGSILDIPSGSGGALFRSVDGGTTWFQMQYPLAIRSSVHSIAISPINPTSAFIIGTAAKGVYLSTNGGGTFTNIDGTGTASPLPDPQINTVWFSRTYYYAGTDSLGGLYRRAISDVSTGWTNGAGLPGAPSMINSVCINPTNGAIAYAGTDALGMYKSLDSGQTWTSSRSGMMGTAGYAIQYNSNGTLFLGTDLGDGMWTSVDSAKTWSHVDSLPTANSITCFGMTSNALILYASTYGSGVFKSTDGGIIWRVTDTTVINHFVRPLQVYPSNPNIVFAGTGDGVFKTTDGGSTWFAVNTGIPASTSIRSMDIVQSNPSVLLAGTDSLFLYRTTDGGATWTHITNANGFLPQDFFIRTITIDQTTPTIAYAGSDSGHIYKSTDGGQQWSLLYSLPIVHSVRKILLHPTISGTLFAATFGDGVFISINGGTSWSPFSTGLTDSSIFTLESDRASPLNLFAGSHSLGVFRTNYLPVNHPPALSLIGNKSVYGGHLLSINVSATDPDLTIPSLSATGLPAGAGFVDHGNGTGTFSWTPTLSQTGIYPVTFRASDGMLSDSQRVSITVVDSSNALIVTVSNETGWNLVSLPVGTTDPRQTQVFPTATSAAYSYEGRYIRHDTLVPGAGYWLKFNIPLIQDLSGLVIPRDTLQVKAGWNLIGSVSAPIPTSTVLSQPPGMVVSRFFAYSGSYVPTDTIHPGKGYWVKVTQPGMLILATGGAFTAAEWLTNRVVIVPGTEMPPDPPLLSGLTGPITQAPDQFILEQNYPNPFNPGTMIRYVLPNTARVTLTVYNVLGERIVTLVDEIQNAGVHTVIWNAVQLPTGTYFYSLQASSGTQELFQGTKTMFLLK